MLVSPRWWFHLKKSIILVAQSASFIKVDLWARVDDVLFLRKQCSAGKALGGRFI